MQIYPAIDLMDGQVVRLEEGKRERKKIYGRPMAFADEFSRHVDKVHVVDLDGAFTGKPRNLDVVREIIRKTGLTVQFGGGIRTLATLKEVKDAGVDNPIIGTKARDLKFLELASGKYQGITVSLDAGQEGLMIEGWSKSTSVSSREAFDKFKRYVDRFVFTAVSKDGKLEGVKDVEKFWGDREVIYAGGVTTLRDLTRLKKWGFGGAIIGKALYEGNLDVEEVINALGDEDAG